MLAAIVRLLALVALAYALLCGVLFIANQRENLPSLAGG